MGIQHCEIRVFERIRRIEKIYQIVFCIDYRKLHLRPKNTVYTLVIWVTFKDVLGFFVWWKLRAFDHHFWWIYFVCLFTQVFMFEIRNLDDVCVLGWSHDCEEFEIIQKIDGKGDFILEEYFTRRNEILVYLGEEQ